MIFTTTFEHPGNHSKARSVEQGTFDRLVDVFRKSCHAVMPNEPFVCQRVSLDTGGYAAAYRHKVQCWRDAVHEYNQPMLLADADMLMLESIADVWKYDFSVAVTRRDELDGNYSFPETVRLVGYGEFVAKPTVRTPINTGVMFVRPCEASKLLFDMWLAECNSEPSKAMLQKYKAVDQAALGCLMESGKVEVLSLPCSLWNSCESSWGRSNAKLVHIKRQLRSSCLGLSDTPARLQDVVTYWQAVEQDKLTSAQREKLGG